jgi:hypothetical protein
MLTKDEKDALEMLRRFNHGVLEITEEEIKELAKERKEMRIAAQGIGTSRRKARHYKGTV